MAFENVNKFTVDLSRELRDASEGEAKKLMVQITVFVLTQVILRTPVDTGYARGNWQLTIGTPAVGTLYTPVDPPDTIEETALTRDQDVISRIPGFGVVYITNNAPYIDVLEFGRFVPPDPGPSSDPRPDRSGSVLVQGGFSTQAPHGIVGVTMIEVETQFGG